MYKVAMAFWINIYECQLYPKYGHLSVNQLKNDRYCQALQVPKLPKLAITNARPVDVALSPSENHVLENFVTHEKNTTPVNPTNKNEIKLKYL